MIFAWDDINHDHIAKHDVSPAEAEFVVEGAKVPFPQEVGDGKRRVWGATSTRRLLQVIYVLKSQNEVAYDSITTMEWQSLRNSPNVKIARVIHAMDLTSDMKRQLKRRRR